MPRRLVAVCLLSIVLLCPSAPAATRDSFAPDSVGPDSIPVSPPTLIEPQTTIQQGDWLFLNDPVSETDPTSRLHTPAAYDPVNDRMILFGGYDTQNALGGLFVLQLRPTPHWIHLGVQGPEPSARWGHTEIYDPIRNRILFFGGVIGGEGFTNELWELALGAMPTWTKLTPLGTPPAARVGHRAVLDSARDRMIVFGGNSGDHTNEVWELSFSPLQWTQLTPSGTPPGPRSSGAAIYDPVGDRMVIFGGADANNYLSDTWALSFQGGPHWSPMLVSGPGPRVLSTGLYDPERGGMWIYGGFGGGNGYTDIWFLQLAPTPTWALSSVPNGPASSRWSQASIYDPVDKRIITFGGVDPTVVYHETWALSVGPTLSWAKLHPGDEVIAPGPRWGHTAFFDQQTDRFLVFGGASINPVVPAVNDLWALPLSVPTTWIHLLPTGTPPTPRFVHATAYDSNRDQLLIFGGNDNAWQHDTWTLQLSDPPAWTHLSPLGSDPPARGAHAAVYDPLGDRLVIFGGRNDVATLGDVWSLPRDGSVPLTWSQVSPLGPAIAEKNSFGSAYDPGRNALWVIGGLEGPSPGTQEASMEVWRLSLTDPIEWVPVATFGTAPSPRWGHSLVYDAYRDRLLLFGGANADRYFSDLWELTLTGTPAWRKIVPAGVPPEPRLYAAAVLDPTRYWMIVNGGTRGFFIYGDTWAWRIDTPTPTIASWVTSEERPDGLHLLWSAVGGAVADIERRTESTEWTRIGEKVADESQRVLYVDTSIEHGARYGYRLRLGNETYGEAWVQTSSHALHLAGLSSNPGTRGSKIGFTLSGRGAARLEMIDPRGRVVFTQEVGSLGPGPHTTGFSGAAIHPGVYWLRLTQGAESRTAKAVLF